MKRLIIDRFEGKYALCEDEEQKIFAIMIGELPEGAKEGSVLDIGDDGTLTVNLKAEEEIRKRILEKQKKLFK